MGRLQRPGRWLALAATMLVAFMVTLALLAIDDPLTVRAKRIDQKRIGDLYRIADALDCYAKYHKGRLPERLEDIRQPPEGIEVSPGDMRRCHAERLTDPETGEPYGYRPANADAYDLCARFARASGKTGNDDYIGPSWLPARPAFKVHEAGTHCFRFKVLRPPS